MKSVKSLLVPALLVLLTPFLLGSGCDRCKNEETFYVPELLYEYVLMPEGSWWVFENLETGRFVDSCIVLEYEKSIDGIAGACGNFELIKAFGYTTFNKEGMISITDSEGGYYSHHFYFPFGSIPTFMQDLIVEIDSVCLTNTCYYDILFCEFGTFSQGYYWARNIGLIKVEFYGDNEIVDSTWVLKRYFIND